MEAAAKKVQLLTQRILPEKPHHLSYSPDRRYRIPADDHKSKHFEEWENTRLQYTTLVSEADRGVLLTRSYYDMRVEPHKPVPREVNILSKAGGEKKKLSLSDYKNKKTPGVTSETTPEPPSSKKRDRDLDRAHGDLKPLSEMRKSDAHRGRENSHSIDPKPPKPRENIVDMRYAKSITLQAQEPPSLTSSRLPPKPPTKASLPPRPMSPPDSRKRMADPDDDHRSQKRSRPDPSRTSDDRSRSRDEPPRRKDRDSLAPSDYPSQRDSKPSASSSLLNGRSSLKGSTATARNPSPAGRARGDSLNGARPNALGSTKNTPTKPDGTSRPSVPPLLSPLHLNLDGRDGADRVERRKAREDAVDGTRPTKPKKQEEPPRIKREKSPLPVRMPTLLSPTLPPLLEAELSKRVKLDAKLEAKLDTKPDTKSDTKPRDDRDREERTERRSEERLKEERTASATARKAPVEQDEDDSGGKEKRKSLIVTLYISKRIRQSVKRYLALPPRKEPSRRERSVSIEPPPAQAKKRPVSTTETIVDSISVKRPRTSSISASSRLPPPPSTPSKKGTTAMSRVSSSNSQVHTPGDPVTATPSAPASSERPLVNGTDAPRADKAEIRANFDKQSRYSNMGRRLKHNGDVAMKRSSQANGSAQHRESGVKLGYVLTVESIIAFMTSFQALNVGRGLSGKACDPASWESLFPLMEFLQKEMRRLDMRRYQPLYALILMLQAVSVEEVVKCYGTFENPAAHISIQDLIRHERNRARLWPLVREANDNIESSSLRASISPWSSLDEISGASMRILRHWCADENVDWSPEVTL